MDFDLRRDSIVHHYGGSYIDINTKTYESFIDWRCCMREKYINNSTKKDFLGYRYSQIFDTAFTLILFNNIKEKYGF